FVCSCEHITGNGPPEGTPTRRARWVVGVVHYGVRKSSSASLVCSEVEPRHAFGSRLGAHPMCCGAVTGGCAARCSRRHVRQVGRQTRGRHRQEEFWVDDQLIQHARPGGVSGQVVERVGFAQIWTVPSSHWLPHLIHVRSIDVFILALFPQVLCECFVK